MKAKIYSKGVTGLESVVLGFTVALVCSGLFFILVVTMLALVF